MNLELTRADLETAIIDYLSTGILDVAAKVKAISFKSGTDGDTSAIIEIEDKYADPDPEPEEREAAELIDQLFALKLTEAESTLILRRLRELADQNSASPMAQHHKIHET